MRIAILQQSYGRFGGAERLFFSHCAEIKKMKRDVIAFYSGKIPAGWSERLTNGLVQKIPPRMSTEFRDPTSLVRFLLKLRAFDKIIIHHHVEPMLAFYISKLFGRKSIWYSGSMFELPWERIITGMDYRQLSPSVGLTAREFYGRTVSKFLLSSPFYGTTVEAARAIDVTTVRRFSKVIANSFFLSRFLQRVYKLKTVPNVVYPGVDPAFERLSSGSQPLEEDYVLAVGSLVPIKNFEAVIKAAADLPSTKVVSIGDGQERRRLKEMATGFDVPIEFRGNSERETELANAYSRCKFLMLLSLYETFGLTPVEAGLFSKPSIVTDQGGPPEVVIDGVTGFVVNPRDQLAVKEKMGILLENDSLRHDMGKRARQNILDKFTLEKSTIRLLEEIEA